MKKKLCSRCKQKFYTDNHRIRLCLDCRNATCPTCGNIFAARRRGRVEPQTFCSSDCYGENKKKIGQKPPTPPKKQRVPVTCPQCGSITMRLPYALRHGIRFCNKACYLAYRKAQRLNGNWNGYFYLRADWIHLRRRIKARDEYTCQICKKKFAHFSRSLTVHHIVPRDTFPQVTDVIHPFSDHPDNLISLCNSCHQKVHMGSASVYGGG